MIDSCPPNFNNGRHDPKVDLGYKSVQVVDKDKAPKYDRELGKHSYIQDVIVDKTINGNQETFR